MTADLDARVAAAAAALSAPPPAPLPGHVHDQLRAAAADSVQGFHRLAGVLAHLDPGWSRPGATTDPARLLEGLARIVVAAEDHRWCSHLRTGGPQPAVARLPLRRVDCRRCARTVRRPPPGETDRCDFCGGRGVTEFTPLVLAVGPLLVLGDGCEECGPAIRAVTGVTS